jgi:phosphatidylglycerophosphatase C
VAGAEVRGAAAYDFDGTLVHGTSFPAFLIRLLGRRRFGIALVGAGPSMLAGYCRTGRDGSKAALLVRAVRGVSEDRAVSVGEMFARELSERIRPELVPSIRWHDDRRHQRILVSASLALYLEPFGRLNGFHPVIATRLEVGPDHRLTGRIDGSNVRAAHKARLLAEVLGPDPVEIWAYGDSPGDREMLAMSQHPIWLSEVLDRPRRGLTPLGLSARMYRWLAKL